MTNLFRVADENLIPLQRSRLTREDQLEGWIAKDPRSIGLEVMIVGRQVPTSCGGRIDLLGLDRDGNATIIELKRDRTPREIVAQILDYASWVRKLSPKDIHDIGTAYLQKSLEVGFEAFFGEPLPDALNNSHSMLIVASEFDAASRRIVEYLSDEYGVSINTAFFNVFEHEGTLLLATDWLIDQEQVVEKARARKQLPWSGWYYVNIGEPDRSWEDMRRYGFIAAGGGTQYSGKLQKLQAGDPVFAYQKGRGYVGYGIVRESSVPAGDFTVDGQALFDLPLAEPKLKHDAGDPELQEYAVGVDWKHTYSLAEAKWADGLFANQNIVCRLTHPATIEFLKQNFLEESIDAGASAAANSMVQRSS
ncbi:MAG: hypothetical protein K1X67_24460 [Fimbriimonadaceae bacterium]|nr:hypothetical protein [Fimbriimonadaceae bacterium]